MTTITPTTSIKVVSVFIANLKVFQNTDLRFNKSYLLTSRGGDGNDVTFPGGGRAPSSLHTTRKVAQKDPIFPP